MNNKKILTYATAVLAVLTFLSLSIWVLAFRTPPATAHFAVLVDPSDSRAGSCSAIGGYLNDVLHSGKVTSRSRLYVYALGDGASADEPVLLDTLKLPAKTLVLEGQRRSLAETQAFTDGVIARCRQQPLKKRSPIVLGIKRVIDSLAAAGCTAEKGCKLYVQTDGQELSEPSVKAALSGARPAGAPAIKISNEAAAVTICGLAQVVEKGRRHDVRTTETADAIWKQIFTNPENVSVQPFCQ